MAMSPAGQARLRQLEADRASDHALGLHSERKDPYCILCLRDSRTTAERMHQNHFAGQHNPPNRYCPDCALGKETQEIRLKYHFAGQHGKKDKHCPACIELDAVFRGLELASADEMPNSTLAKAIVQTPEQRIAQCEAVMKAYAREVLTATTTVYIIQAADDLRRWRDRLSEALERQRIEAKHTEFDQAVDRG